MRNGNRIKTAMLVLAGSILLWLGSRQSVLAENTLQIGIDQYEVTEQGKILVYVNQNGEDIFKPIISESSLLIGKNSLEIEEMKSLSEVNESITYLCLVDISGSMTEEGIDQTKEILKQFADRKNDQDNFCITTMGNDVESSGFLTDKTALMEAVEGIERIGSEDTNLYYSITEALNVLKTDKAVHKKRCLLIFSDGEDDQKKGITQKEAEDAVKESHIPVFTVMLPGKNLKDAEESVKILGSFARNSAGGEHYAPPLEDGYEYGDICGKVNNRLQASLIVSGSLSEVKEVGDDTVYIGVTLSDGTEKAMDGITVPAGTILEAIEAIEEAQKTAELQETVVNDKQELEEILPEPSKLNKKVMIGIALLFLVLLLVLILFLSRKKASQEDFDEDEEEHGKGDNYDVSLRIPVSGTGVTVAPGGFDPLDAAVEPVKENKRRVQITLFQIGPGKTETYKFPVKDKAVIGRNKSCQLSLDNDTALSGKHCSILYKDGIVYIKDEASTNGTFVNGVPVVGEYKVEKDDILLIGSFEYRIVWE